MKWIGFHSFEGLHVAQRGLRIGNDKKYAIMPYAVSITALRRPFNSLTPHRFQHEGHPIAKQSTAPKGKLYPYRLNIHHLTNNVFHGPLCPMSFFIRLLILLGSRLNPAFPYIQGE